MIFFPQKSVVVDIYRPRERRLDSGVDILSVPVPRQGTFRLCRLPVDNTVRSWYNPAGPVARHTKFTSQLSIGKHAKMAWTKTNAEFSL